MISKDHHSGMSQSRRAHCWLDGFVVVEFMKRWRKLCRSRERMVICFNYVSPEHISWEALWIKGLQGMGLFLLAEAKVSDFLMMLTGQSDSSCLPFAFGMPTTSWSVWKGKCQYSRNAAVPHGSKWSLRGHVFLGQVFAFKQIFSQNYWLCLT